ncbi:hypothetical protein [Tenacibaculum xiamenense]
MVKSLSYEAREKLSKIQPTSISQVSRMSEISTNTYYYCSYIWVDNYKITAF